MALSINGLLFDELTSDPGSPSEGQMWYNTTSKLFKIYRDGETVSFTDSETFTAHSGSTSNPHSTTLEQARTAGATLAGAINMGTYAITNMASPTNDGDAANKGWTNSQITSRIRGLDWQDSVLDKDLTAPPGGESVGNRYIVASPATGDWLGKEKQIAECTSTGPTVWAFIVPNEGFCTRVEDENILYMYDGSAWGNIGGAVDHGSLVGLGDDDHSQYLLVTGTRSMTGSLNMGTNAITNVGNVDGVDVSSHASRHNGGSDAISLTSSGGQGLFPQSHRSATANPTVNDDGTAGWVVGSLWFNTSNKTVWACEDNSTGAAVWKELTNTGTILQNKAGKVLAASFSGTPKKATVTFSTAFADTDYSAQITCVTTNGRTFAPVVESQLAGSFVINLGCHTTTDLTQVNWHCTKSGESV